MYKYGQDRGPEASSSFLKTILNSAHYGIANYEPMRDASGRITDFRIAYTNAEVPGNFGLDPERVTGRSCREVYPGIFENGVFEKLVHCVESGQPEKYEVRTVNDNGQAIWLTAVVEKVGASVTVTSKNITEEKEAEIRLQDMNRLLANKNRELEREILREFSGSFTAFSTGPAFFDALLGELYRKTNMDVISVATVVAGEDADVMRTVAIAKAGEAAVQQHFLPDGPFAIILGKGKELAAPAGADSLFGPSDILKQWHAEGFCGLPLHDSRGKVCGVISAANRTEIRNTDYVLSLLKIAATRCEMELERQRNERMLEEKNTELENKNKELESFNYIASHDLQEPLRKIQLFTSRIEENDFDKLSAASREHFAGITAAAERMQRLIAALLSYSTADFKGKVFEKTDLNVILKEVESDLEEYIAARGAVIRSEKLPLVWVIPFQFRQLLANLISNGIKYGRAGVAPEIHISSRVTEDSAGRRFGEISVADNGIGFEVQYKDKIFELFQRLHGKHEFAGTGIGLAICKKIVENHKGEIRAESTPGEGSVFTIALPLKR